MIYADRTDIVIKQSA